METPIWHELTPRQTNAVICNVNAKRPVEQIAHYSEAEAALHRSIWREAETLSAKYGSWPVFDLCELD